MAITDPAAIKYSNRFLRPGADFLAKFYYQVVQVNDLWESLGGTNDEKWAVPQMKDAVHRLAHRATWTYHRLVEAHDRWGAESLGALIPNNAAEEIHDAPGGGGQDPARPPITGQDAFRVKQRMEELINWFEADQFVTDASVTNPRDRANWQNFLRVNQDRAKVDSQTAWGTMAAKTMADAIRLNYETTNPSHLGHILAVAVNPNL